MNLDFDLIRESPESIKYKIRNKITGEINRDATPGETALWLALIDANKKIKDMCIGLQDIVNIALDHQQNDFSKYGSMGHVAQEVLNKINEKQNTHITSNRNSPGKIPN